MSLMELMKSALPMAGTKADATISSTNCIITNTPTKISTTMVVTTTPISNITTLTTTTGTEVINSPIGSIARTKVQLPTTTNTTATPAANNEKQENTSATSSTSKSKTILKTVDEFYKDLQQFHERRNTPITHMPKISGYLINLYGLYLEVTERGGFHKVNTRDEWQELLPVIGVREQCVNASAIAKQIYRRYLEKYERLTFFGEDPDKFEAAEAADAHESGRSRSSRYASTLHGSNSYSSLNTVPMSYNYRQHIVNMERRRTFNLSTNLHKHSNYEKLLLSLLSPLPNEQDFAINVCSLMANESKLTLKLFEYPKLLDALLAHTGVYADLSLQKLFEHVYSSIRCHSLYGFWRDLLLDKPQILNLYTAEQNIRETAFGEHCLEQNNISDLHLECFEMDFLNLGREHGTQEYVGMRVLQILTILRNLSFFDENIIVFAKSRTFLRFVVMCANVRWNNIYNQALDIAGNVASELDLLDPSVDELSRSLMATLCDGIEGEDRSVIINSLEILYKICQRENNEDYINKCLNEKFYEKLCLYLSLNDIMLVIFTLEAIYALTSMGARSCHLLMQVRGIVDQLVSLITIEAQAYGAGGCILMRVVETVPGNMLPIVAQNIANLQTAAVTQNKIQQPVPQTVVTAALPQTSLSVEQTKPTVIQPVTQTVNNNEPQQVQPFNNLNNPQALVQQTNSQINNSQNGTHNDEKYALSWLGVTFERAAGVESRIEQQELYRMYLSHCQKSGKISVVNHVQFPRLVRLIFTNTVGPMAVKRADGTELPGLFYVALRLRAQPLPMQNKLVTQNLNKNNEQRDIRKKTVTKLNEINDEQQGKKELDTTLATTISPITTTTTTSLGTGELAPVESVVDIKPQLITVTSSTMSTATMAFTSTTSTQPPALINTALAPPTPTSIKSTNLISNMIVTQAKSTTTNTNIVTQQQTPTSSSLIKSLLANKVTQRQQKQKEFTSITSMPTMTTSNVISTQHHQQTPIKVASTAISALVNNSLMQSTPVKVGQTTIKPINPQIAIEKKLMETSAPPPLAPLSGNNVAKDASGRPVIIANQMLVEILDKKSSEPPIPTTIIKRKIDEKIDENSLKRLAYDGNGSVIAIVNSGNNSSGGNIASKNNNLREEFIQVTPSKNAANLYAEMAASILEDEDLEDIPTLMTHGTNIVLNNTQDVITTTPQPVLKLQQAPSIQNLPRQLLFQSPGTQQLKLATNATAQLPTAMATIKTDQGLQTVPVILQQKSLETTQPQILQQVIQQTTQQPTQYVLATNQQGQTYLVAQTSQTAPPQPQTPTQTVLLTHASQQQQPGTKTIIILQQQAIGSGQNNNTVPQKMIMTTPQGQSLLVTQRTQQVSTSVTSTTPSGQIFINPQTGAASHIQPLPVNNTTNNMLQRQLIQTAAITPPLSQPPTQTTPPPTGQISPTLLSQLNHIPATIKLHQPNNICNSFAISNTSSTSTATISRIGKNVSIVQTPAPASLLTDQRKVIFTGNRGIEIKETIITPTPTTPPIPTTIPIVQQTQLTPQTIITTTQKVNINQSSLPVSKVNTSNSAQVIVSQTPLLKKTVIARGTSQIPSSISVIKSNSNISNTGPPPLAVSSNNSTIITTAESQPIQQPSELLKIEKDDVQANNSSTNNLLQSTQTNTIISTNTTTSILPTTTITTTATNQLITTSTTTIASTGIITTTTAPTTPTNINALNTTNIVTTPHVDINWLFVCDWRNCPRRKFKTLGDLMHHACNVHCPDHLDPAAEIFCQWGVGPGLCDNVPRKRYSLMTHLIDRHLTVESLRLAVQRRISAGGTIQQPTQAPVTIIRNMNTTNTTTNRVNGNGGTSQSALTESSTAFHAIKRHTADYLNSKELADENEGPVTKSIRLTASLILRNLVTYTNTAKRTLRRHEPHLANIAMSNVESSGAISHILYELNN